MTHIQIIINPAAGQDEPILNTLNTVFDESIDWQVAITRKAGDAQRMTRAALDRGVDIIAAYGGDGTLAEVAAAMAGSDIPLGILPGGTGNGVAHVLNIPTDLTQAAQLLLAGHTIRALDLGRLNDHRFLLRASIGFLAEASADTTRASKDRFGKLAYALSGLQHLPQLAPVPYELTLDGEQVAVQAVLIQVLNMSATAFGNRPVSADNQPDDGLLDVLVMTRSDPLSLIKAAGSVLVGNDTVMQHWQVRSATISSPQAPQKMTLDGEPIEDTPAHIEVLPAAVRVIVPA